VANRALAAAGILALLAGCTTKPAGDKQPLTPEARAYVRDLRLGEVSLKATESYAKQTITEIQGKITNAGGRAVGFAEVVCVFYDSYGQIVKRERVPIVKTMLKPGETRAFRLPFDDLPSSWNNQMPQLVIARIDFV